MVPLSGLSFGGIHHGAERGFGLDRELRGNMYDEVVFLLGADDIDPFGLRFYVPGVSVCPPLSP